MPGIFGIITNMHRERAEGELREMSKTLRHEPFYTSGTLVDSSLGVYAGWIARANSFSDKMPLKNETGDVTLVFSGEDFPDHGVKRQLKDRGHSLEENRASYLVHLYEEDPRFLSSLNGRFQGLVADCTRGIATLFNDRYGMHRLYYHQSDEGFYFASEAKAILAVRPELRKIDPRGLGEFVACGCVLENRTVFEGVHVLPPGSSWTFRDGAVERKGKYFEQLEWEQQGCLDSQAYYSELREVFARNLPRYFNGGEPVGMSLTGGLDTRMIMAWHKADPGSLPCYS